jgi:hypothetical protein
MVSPLVGAEGNVEFLAHFVTGAGRPVAAEHVDALVAEVVDVAVSRRTEV